MLPNRISAALHTDLDSSAAARKTVIRRRGRLISGGARAHNVYLVLSGLIKRETAADSARTCILQIAGPECLLGEEALAGEPAYISTATAITDAEVLTIPAEGIREVCHANPLHWHALTRYFIAERAALEERIERLCFTPVRERVLACLDELTNMIQGGAEDQRVTIPLSQAELAHYLGATRETTSTVLNRLACEGIVSLHHRAICLLRRTRAEVTAAGTAGPSRPA